MTIDEFAATDRVRLRAIAAFLILGFILSWYPWIFALLRHTTTGPNPLGLFVAALIVSAVTFGWRGAVNILRGIVRVRVPLSSWLAAFLLPIGILAITFIVAMAFGITIKPQPPPWSDLLDRFIFTLLFVALGEEPGWRGFLLPLLQRQLSPLIATLILAAIWAVWHLPLWGDEFAWNVVPAFLVSVVGGAIALTWLYNSSRSSILMPMLMHATINTVGAGYAFHFVNDSDLLRLWWIYAVLWVMAGAIIVVATHTRLGLPQEQTAER